MLIALKSGGRDLVSRPYLVIAGVIYLGIFLGNLLLRIAIYIAWAMAPPRTRIDPRIPDAILISWGSLRRIIQVRATFLMYLTAVHAINLNAIVFTTGQEKWKTLT